jgi:hypothetical protein
MIHTAQTHALDDERGAHLFAQFIYHTPHPAQVTQTLFADVGRQPNVARQSLALQRPYQSDESGHAQRVIADARPADAVGGAREGERRVTGKNGVGVGGDKQGARTLSGSRRVAGPALSAVEGPPRKNVSDIVYFDILQIERGELLAHELGARLFVKRGRRDLLDGAGEVEQAGGESGQRIERMKRSDDKTDNAGFMP